MIWFVGGLVCIFEGSDWAGYLFFFLFLGGVYACMMDASGRIGMVLLL